MGFFLLQRLFGMIFWQVESFYNLYYGSESFEIAFDSVFMTVCLGLPFLLVYNYEKKYSDREVLPLGRGEGGADILLLIAAGFGACIISNYAAAYLSDFFQYIFEVDFYGPEYSFPEAPFDIILYFSRSAVIPAVVEEFAIRGVVMQPLRKYGDWFAILTSSMVFSLMHGNMVQIPFAFLAGLILGFIVIKTGSLWAGIAVHFLNNALSITQNLLYHRLSEGSFAFARIFSELLFVFAGLACGLIYLKIFLDKKKRRQEDAFYVYNGGNYGPPRHFKTKIPAGKRYARYIFSLPMIAAVIYMVYQTLQYIG